MLSVVTWLWGRKFSAAHVNTLRSMLHRNLMMSHRLFCVTNQSGLDGDITRIPEFDPDTTEIRCRRRMRNYSEELISIVGPRSLFLDLDIVITGDVTPLFKRDEPLVLWRVGYANVYSGSVQLMATGLLDGLWRWYRMEPERLARAAEPRGNGSDQAMLNYYLRCLALHPPEWTERDGIHSFFGNGYERFAHLGVGPQSERLPDGCRMVVMGSDDLEYLKMPLWQEHYR